MILGPLAIDYNEYEVLIGTTLLQSPMIAASILLIIGTFRETAKLRKIAYIIIAVFGFVAFVAVLVSIITATSYEGFVLAIFVAVGTFFMSLGGIGLFFTVQEKKVLWTILTIVSVVGMCVGLLTVVYVLLFVAGLLINKKQANVSVE